MAAAIFLKKQPHFRIKSAKNIKNRQEMSLTVSKILFNTRYKTLNEKPLQDLFDTTMLGPPNIRKIAESMESGKLDLTRIVDVL